ncbi:twin-arginine translocase subunit TatC [Beggiatoa leptomitoformis]|uniref:Sec-independent protein translocase protein TatC n=1 Tax=Beggiatoa leptomitoformis TaxID=288004 RepID=A0A2N9YIW4_9GAMM|nr:twin-arginine translocase subunit TatC [Beggiatoa leptomitoformis]ALG67418.1 twin-arginine translocase subunit TatC [Beggiatoa leptomitoformis]AUI70369.1 twin-arginine translocase subunit TatC [Beggiatoa leptomitoformis]
MSQTPPPSGEMPFIEHLVELRDRLLKIILGVGIIVAILLPFSNNIYAYFAKPLISLLPMGTQMIAIDVASPFFTPMKLILVLAIFLAIPLILYHFWAFVTPGLYKHEQELIFPLLVSSTLLFYIGAVFAYYVVFPMIFSFMVSTTPDGVAMMTDIGRYLDFILTVFFAFGIAFQVPVITVVLVWLEVITPEHLTEKRAYIIVGAFIIGAILTPPDVISQTLLAVPMLVLFEIGLFISRLVLKKKRQRQEAEEMYDNDYHPLTTTEMDDALKKAEEEDKRLRGEK